MWRLITAELIT